MTVVHVLGIGMWAPRWPSWDAWRDATPDEDATRPEGTIIAPRQRRRATPLANAADAALSHALEQAGLGADEPALLLGSVGGELGHTFANFAAMHEDPPASSPLRFGNSVHNAALGHLAISAGNRWFASAIASPDGLVVPMTLLEAIGWAVDAGRPAAALLCDDRWPTDDHAPLAVAVLLSPEAGPRSLARLDVPSPREPTLPGAPRRDPDVLANPCAHALDLLAAIDGGRAGTIALSEDALPWCVHVTPEGP